MRQHGHMPLIEGFPTVSFVVSEQAEDLNAVRFDSNTIKFDDNTHTFDETA